jgi:hypothetical protein
VKVQLLEFPAASVAVAVTVVVPTGNTEPETTLVETLGEEQLSVAVGAGKLTGILTAELFAGRLTTMFAGQDSTGADVSFTVKLVFDELEFPAASTAVTVTWCVPKPTIVPAAGLCVSVTGPQLSEATVPEVKSGMAA